MGEHEIDVLAFIPFGNLLEVVDEESVAGDVNSTIEIINMRSVTAPMLPMLKYNIKKTSNTL